jgi:hypothetical protein
MKGASSSRFASSGFPGRPITKHLSLLISEPQRRRLLLFSYKAKWCTLTFRSLPALRAPANTEQPSFIENGWVGHKLQLGDGTRVNVALLDPRCVMATLAQDDLPQDTDVLRTLVRHNRMQIGDFGQFPCAGAYAVVAAPGTVRTGDHVTVV